MGFNLFPTGGRVMEKAKRIVALALTIAMVFGLCDWAPMGRALAEFTLPHFLLDIGEGAFSGDESLTGVLTTNENLETIGEDAFRGTNFFGAELNGGLKTVGDGALASGSLAYAWVEDAETAVGSGAFADSIYIFGHVSSAVKDWYDDESPSAEFIPIEETKKDATFLYRVVGAGETQEAEVLIPRNGDQEEELVVIPEQIDGVTVTALSENAFHGLDEVSLVVLPENLIPQAEALKDDLAPGAEFITHEYNQESDFQYTVLDKTEKTCRVDAYLGRSQIVDIPPTLGGYQVLSIGRNAFSAWSDYFSGDEWNWRYEHPVLSITLPEGMTKLEDSSLLGAHHVRNVKLPSTLTYIGNNAFGNTRYLRTVALPQGLTRISSYAFSNSGIRTITLPASLEIMGDERGYPQSAFTYCSRLTEILVAPGNQDFSSVDGVLYTKNLERIVCYPAGRRDESFTLPEGVRTIPYETFSGMRYLKRLGLPVSMDGSLNGIFGSAGGRDACSVSWIEVNSTNGKFSSMDGIVYNKAGTELVLCPPAYAEKKVRLPEGMTKLTERAFSGCVYLEEVVLPSGLREIGDSAFSGCASLRKIDLPGSLTAIGRDAFSYCDSLATLEIPSGVKELPARMAYGCFNLSNVILHEGLTKIGKDTFAQCNLMRLTLPESVTEIGKEAFYGSSNLILRLPSNLKTVSDDGPFCNIRQLEVPASAPALKVSMFKSSAYNSGETEGKPELLILEKGGKSGTFAEKNGYKSVTVSLTGGEAAVLGGTPESGTWSSGWTDIYITIPNEAFGCRVTSIGAGAFQDSELNVTMPDTIRSIGENAFRGAKEQWNTALPKELVSLGENAFRGSGMSSVTIPYRVSAIPAGCFAGLSSFSAHIGAQTEVDGTAFEGVGKLWLYGKTGSPAHDYYLSHSQQQTIYWQNSSVSAEYQSGDWMYTVDETREEATLTGYIGSATEVTVPATIGGYPVSDVDYDIFEENAAIERVTFEAQMEYLPLFKDCVSLREVVLPAGLKSIPSSAFKNCVSLHTLNFPETVEEIRSSAFENSNLEVLPLLPNLKTIGDEAFRSCRSLREIHLPEGLEALCDESYDGGTNKWAATFAECTNLHEVVIPDTVTRVGGTTFMNGGVTSIHLGSGIKELPYNFFYYPQSGKLTELELPPNLKSIGEGAVQYNNLSAITIPYGCESIGKQAFESNTELSEAYIPSTVAEIGSDAFGNCSDYLIIYGAVGSEAERYARENGIRFRSSGEAPVANVTFQIVKNDEVITSTLVGSEITFNITAPGATRVRLVVDGEDTLSEANVASDGTATLIRRLTSRGTFGVRQISFRALVDGVWSAPCTAQELTLTKNFDLTMPTLTGLDIGYTNSPYTVEWDAVKNAGGYSLYIRYPDGTAQNETEAVTFEPGQAHYSYTFPAGSFPTAGTHALRLMVWAEGADQVSGEKTITVEPYPTWEGWVQTRRLTTYAHETGEQLKGLYVDHRDAVMVIGESTNRYYIDMTNDQGQHDQRWVNKALENGNPSIIRDSQLIAIDLLPSGGTYDYQTYDQSEVARDAYQIDYKNGLDVGIMVDGQVSGKAHRVLARIIDTETNETVLLTSGLDVVENRFSATEKLNTFHLELTPRTALEISEEKYRVEVYAFKDESITYVEGVYAYLEVLEGPKNFRINLPENGRWLPGHQYEVTVTWEPVDAQIGDLQWETIYDEILSKTDMQVSIDSVQTNKCICSASRDGFVYLHVRSDQFNLEDMVCIEVCTEYVDEETFYEKVLSYDLGQESNYLNPYPPFDENNPTIIINPMDDRTIYNTIVNVFTRETNNNELAIEWAEIIKQAPRLYQRVYLLSFFDYIREISLSPEEDGENSYHWIGRVYMINKHLEDESIFFHESGHAIDYVCREDSVGMKTTSNTYKTDIYNSLYWTIYGEVAKIALQCASDFEDLTQEEIYAVIDYIMSPVYAFIVHKKSEGSDGHEDTYKLEGVELVGDYSDIQKTLFKKMCDKLHPNPPSRINAEMYYDAFCGMTNQTTGESGGHGPATTYNKGLKAYNKYYWYDKDTLEPTYSQNKEAWAEYFSSMMTGYHREENRQKLPEACELMDQMAREMVEYLENRHR